MKKQTKTLFLITGILLVFLVASCDNTLSNPAPKPMDELNIPDDFTFETTKSIEVEHDFGSNFPHIPINIYASVYSTYKEVQTEEDFLVGTRMTDNTGKLNSTVTAPSRYTTLIFEPNFIGLPQQIRNQINSRATTREFSTRKPDDDLKFSSTLPTRGIKRIKSKITDNYWYIIEDDYSKEGRPDSAFNISLDKDFLSKLNNSIFKYNKEKEDAPQVLTAGLKVGTLDMSKDTGVWLTFIGERANYNNTLGFYTYPTASKPANIKDKDITIVFPNTSLGAESDPLKRGDTVYIGEITKDHSLGFVMITDGYSSRTGKVQKEGKGLLYSESRLNTKLSDGDKERASIIHYTGEYGNKVYLLGMEDEKHTEGKDYNFNDLVIAIVVKDATAVNALASNDIPNVIDSDGDEVPDNLDAYPDDPKKSTKEVVSGTLAYEDQWPKLGDYDFNDLVVGYEYTIAGNKENKIVSIDFTYTLKASGAGYPNGLALSLPLKNSDFTISQLSYSKTAIEPKDAEVEEISDGEKSHILIFDRQDTVMGESSNPFNTHTSNTIETGKTPKRLPHQSVSFTVDFGDNPISRDTLDAVPYDVFMLVDNVASDNKEVHLVGFEPSSIANDGFLTESEDNGNKDYYKSSRNLPWAVHIPGEWQYPLERKSIVDGYNYFGAWAESGGTTYKDWYVDKPNYRNFLNLY